MLRALKAEIVKLRGARMLVWTALAVALVPFVVTCSIRLVDPHLHDTTWGSFMRLAPQMMASWWGILLFGLAASYLFGREFADGTATTMLTLPMRRESFVGAKMAVLAVWVFGLAALAVMLQAAGAVVLGLPGFAWEHVRVSLAQSMHVALVIYLTLPVVSLLAMRERGYLAPMLFSGFMATAGLVFAVVGWSRWFPWSMPQSVAGSSFGPLFRTQGLVLGSWVIAFGLFAVGLAVLFWQVDRADSPQ
jgi:ABC-2 type transport system permease protein